MNYSPKKKNKDGKAEGEWDSPAHRNATLPNPHNFFPHPQPLVKPNVFSRRQGWKMLQRWRGGGWRLSLGNHRSKRRRETRIPRNGRLEVDLVLATCMEVSLRQILERLAGLGTVPYGRYSGAKGSLRTAAGLPGRRTKRSG